MTTSGTYTFNPALGEIGLMAFARIGVRRTEIVASHMADLQNCANLVLSEWSNRQVNLWEVGLSTLPLVAGTATYNVNAEVVMILDLYISTTSGGTTSDRLVFPISRSEYASLSNKTQQGPPTSFWFDRITSPTLTFWPVPDSATTYTAKYYSVRQTQDANLANGQNVEVPYRWLDAFVAALAWRLAEIYRPELAQEKMGVAERAWQIAATQDTENVPIYIIPGTQGYWT